VVDDVSSICLLSLAFPFAIQKLLHSAQFVVHYSVVSETMDLRLCHVSEGR
jgi:hypothetical protein